VNPFALDGRVAVVTGGNGGIGLGMARGLAAAGADVAVWGRNEAKNGAAVAELEDLGAEAAAFSCDVSVEDDIVEAMAASVDRFGKVDSCFVNAGIGSGATRFAEMSLEEWRAVMRVNLDGAFLTVREAVRHMAARGAGGSIVVTSSMVARFGMPRGEHYASTKSALLGLVRSVAVEHGRHGIRINAILPGWVESAMTEPVLGTDRFQANVKPRIPLGRWGAPDDFAGIAVYLASNASRYHTADTITIDGGYSVF